MSNTYRDNRRVKLNKFREQETYDSIYTEELDYEKLHDLGLTTRDLEMEWPIHCAWQPKWFRKLFQIRPNRRKEKLACHRVLKSYDYDDCFDFPCYRKPQEYYW